VYRKPTHTNLYLNSSSHHHPPNKHAVLCTLVHKARAIDNIQELCATKPAFMRSLFMPFSRLAYSSTLKMKATCSSETSVDFQQSKRHYIPEDRTHLNQHRPTVGISCADHATSFIRNGTNFANKQRSVVGYNSLADQSHGV
jgi:hypothetical protein